MKDWIILHRISGKRKELWYMNKGVDKKREKVVINENNDKIFIK